MLSLKQLPVEGSGILGLPMSILKKQMADFIKAVDVPLEVSAERMVEALIAAWRLKDRILTCEVRGTEYVWQRDPKAVPQDRKDARIERLLETDVVKEAAKEGGIVDALFADLDEKRGYPTRLGRAVH